ncbi:polysaccharide biosynthesis tyrosine autokinase [Tessaracoccus lacteus]|uniref:Polysaccharide biosynthesis tyrosine autokinase n=1 Tax=Tessaracoccus lacteus TaxID=3041766 RepID=A0ABY8PWF6_9ACTN|nr:polysaccharide biosynthesis tyrosine autokinase [Tessaracoccus sp. T21]WGT46722.1 polysaccharide biosynthesis tyrosine autokinase [Tessaracoccus sp. T21]
MTVGDAIRLLRAHWLFIVLATLLGAAAGIGLAATRTPEFTASADVVITVTSGQTTGELAQGSTFSQQQARNFAAIATREIVLAPVIEELNLDTTVERLRRSVSASVPLNTSLVTIEATNPEPAVAAAIANSTANHLAETVAGLSPKVDDVSGSPVKAQLIESATVPRSPSSPNIGLFAIFGALAGLLVGLAYQVIAELSFARVRTADELTDTLGLTPLGTISRDRAAETSPVAVASAPLSVRSEQVRQIRTALKFLPGSDHRALVFSSAISGEGKSTTAMNLAAAFAAEGVSTCLVESDLRRPVLVEALDLTGGAGLTDVIVGDCELDDALQPWGPDDLQVLIAGTVPPNPSELLGSERGREVLDQIHRRFDVVVIDSPPLNAVTDAKVLGRQFGGIVLVVGAHRARTADLRRALTALEIADVPLKGSILNLVRDNPTPNAYAYSHNLAAHGAPQRASVWDNQRLRTVGKVALAAAVALCVAVAGMLLSSWTGNASNASASQASSPAVALGDPKPVAVLVGDSLVQGIGGDGTTWPSLVSAELGWDEVNLGRAATGYVTSADASACGHDTCPTFVEMADVVIAVDPDVVLVSGGAYDGDKDVAAASLSLFEKLRSELPAARIVVLSPMPVGNTTPDTLSKTASAVAHSADQAGADYLEVGFPLAHHEDLFTQDGKAPNADGYGVLADTITEAITS